MLYNTSFIATPDFPWHEVLQHNKTLYEDARKRGGCRYPVDATGLDSCEWEEHFGTKWSNFCAIKQKYDPHFLLNTGNNIVPLLERTASCSSTIGTAPC
jgi:FAD/FMN-containing dehydrogenase